jgi:hypothetical protein
MSADLLVALQALTPYFYLDVFRRVKVDEQCAWEQLAANNTTPSSPQNTLEEDATLYEGVATRPGHCVHNVQIVDSANDQLIGRHIRVPGVLLLRFMDRFSVGHSDRTRQHLALHCGANKSTTAAALHALIDHTIEALVALAEAQFHAVPDVPSGETLVWLMDQASFVGRYAHCVLSGVRGALHVVVTPDSNSRRRLLMLDDTQRRRVLALIQFDVQHMLSTASVATSKLLVRDTVQRDAVLALLGQCVFASDFDTRHDVRLVVAASSSTSLSQRELSAAQKASRLRTAAACCVCQENVAQVLILPCKHLVLCIACSLLTYHLKATSVLPNGMPQLPAGARCVTCGQTARTCCRPPGLVSQQ